MDHIGVLGDTLEEITENKAGILKKGAAAVTGGQQQGVLRLHRLTAEDLPGAENEEEQKCHRC